MRPWEKFDAKAGLRKSTDGWNRDVWAYDTHPYVVRWDVPSGYTGPGTGWRSIHRNFATMEEAIAAYRRPFRGIAVDCVVHNGGPPGRHLTRLAWRNASKPHHWHDSVPQELRA